MLTDEERTKILSMHASGSLYDLSLAIERALLAKAMPIPKQEPVAVMGNNGRTQAKWEFADEDSFLKCCRNNTPLYAEPQPAQAAAIPEGYALVPLEPSAEQQAAGAQAIRIDTTVINKMFTANRVYRDMLSASTKPE